MADGITEPEGNVESAADVNDRRLIGDEMSRFYRALTIFTSNAVHRVMKEHTSSAEKVHRATIETQHLIAAINSGGNHKCQPGMIWDEFLRRCVPIE